MAVSYNTTSKEITVTSLTRLQDVYTDAEDTFAGSTYMQYLPPLQANTPTLFTLINGWTFAAGSVDNLKSAALQDAAGNNIWTNVQTVGTIVSGTTLYISQGGAVTYTAGATGHIDMLLPVKVGGTLTAGGVFTVYARKFEQTYSQFQATGGANVAICPLATQADINLTIDNTTLDGYADITVTYGSVNKDTGDGAGAQPYGIVISTSNASRTLYQIYNWIQYKLLSGSTLGTGTGSTTGKLTNALVSFAGGKMFTAQGVWVEGFAPADNNNVQYVDSNGATHVPPLSIAVTVNIDPALTVSGSAQVAVFHLSTPYVAATYDPSQITSTLINAAVPEGQTQAATSLTYTADFPVLVVVRKAGFQSFSQGVTVSTGGLNVTAQNPVDTIYGA